MSSIASPSGTDPGAVGAVLAGARTPTVIAALLLTALLVTFQPFQTGAEPIPEGGDIVNQLGFGSLGALAFVAMLCLADRRVAAALISPWWLILLVLLSLSVVNATEPREAFRAAMFTVIGIAAVAAVLALPRDGEGFSTVLAIAGFAVVGLCYAGIVLAPEWSIHGADAYEPQHAGFWRGSFSHKNIAGPVMACLSFAGIYLFRRGRRWSGLLLFALAIAFVANTGSKTTLGLVPLAILLVIAPRAFGVGFLTPVLFFAAMAGTALATLGIVFIEPLKDFAAEHFPDLTYTGRIALWEFSGEMLARRPWTGYGYESFWGTPFLFTMDQPFDRAWDIRGIVHGHNGYLDIAVIMGVPALFAALVALVLAPLRDYCRVPLLKENVFLADFFMMALSFTALNAFLESFFFQRADPVWLFMVMAALGLRLVARLPIPASAPS